MLLEIGLGIATVSFALLWLDERLMRKTAQSSCEFWRSRALGENETDE